MSVSNGMLQSHQSGEPGTVRRRRLSRGLRWSALLVAVLLVAVGSDIAVHVGGLFELGDGTGASGKADILGSGAQPGCDWADLFDATPTPDEFEAAATACGGVTAIFIRDQLSAKGLTDDTIFAQSNKNNDLISTWNWDTGNNPPKDDISNVYAFGTLNAFDELIIYAGLERLAPEGDSHVDFEFNQSTIGLDKAPPCGSDGTAGAADGSPCEFTGEKTVNDLLVVMDFERGGKLGFVEIRRWNGTQYVLVSVLGGEGCNGTDTVCAFNNNVSIDGGPWPNFERGGGVITNLPPNSFTEVGINVTALLGMTPCFGTIQSKTRSSQSFNSELKDFAFGDFDICSIEITKDGPPLSKIGDEATYTFTIENTGAVELHLHSVVDDKIGDLAAAAAAAGCDPLGPGDSCTFDVAFTIPASASDPFENTVQADYDPTTALSGPHVLDDDDHSANLFQPSLTIDKTGDALSKAGDAVDYVITVTNTSSSDSPDLLCTIADALLGLNKNVTLAPGASDVTNVSRTVLATDADPLVNTANVSCQVDGFSNVLDQGDSHETNLFQPSVDVVKSGDDLSKVGDAVDYTITVTNTSSADSPGLVNGTIVDTLLGDLLDPANPFVTSSDCTSTLAPGGSCTIQATRTVASGDDDPLPNTVTVTYNPAGFPNVISDSDGHSVELFQPSVDIDKSGDALSKAGDAVDYVITVTNTSSADSPNLTCTITDALLGINKNVNLAPGAVDVTNASRTVLPTDPDPLPNTADVSCTVDGFGNVVSDSDGHSVNLFQPSVAIDKSGDALSKAGDTVDYVITVTNTSSADSPSLNCTITDPLLGINKNVALAPGAVDVTNASRVVLAMDPDPLVNTATATCRVDGFPNVLTASDSHAVDLVHPDYTLLKECAPIQATIGENITYTITIQNTGDVALDRIGVTDSLLGDVSASFPATIAPGPAVVVVLNRSVQAGDPDPLINMITATYRVQGLPNQIARDSSCSVDIIGCALSPGFWGGGSGVPKWDQATDPIAMTAGFTTGTVFPWLHSSLAGSTYLQVLKLSALGDVTRQMAFKYIAARLNEATFGVPSGIDTLLDSIDVYFMSNPVGSNPQGAALDQGKALLTQLNTYFAVVGEEFCPDPSTF